MRPYIDQMRENLADTLKIDLDRVNVKANDGRGTGIYRNRGKEFPLRAVCLLQSLLDGGGG